MKTHTVFTLLDGSQHTTIKAALNHCDEMMGAELRGFLYDCQGANTVYKQALKIVSEKAYDKEFKLYLAWRAEHDELLSYEVTE